MNEPENKLRQSLTSDEVSGEIKDDTPMNAVADRNDALNPMVGAAGQAGGSHQVDVNQQTDLELGALADPGGMDPAYEEEKMEEDMRKVRERLKS